MTDIIPHPPPGIAIVLFETPIPISCVTKDNGPLTKILRLDPETKTLIKDGSECSMSLGYIKTIPFSSPAGFARLLRSRKNNQAIVHGLSQYAEARVVTKSQLEKAGTSGNGLPVISRTKECISYYDGPGVILFDHDKARSGAVGSGSAKKAYSSHELIGMLSNLHPAIASAAWVSTPSTSACLSQSLVY